MSACDVKRTRMGHGSRKEPGEWEAAVPGAAVSFRKSSRTADRVGKTQGEGNKAAVSRRAR
jgi:hypothetical protein